MCHFQKAKIFPIFLSDEKNAHAKKNFFRNNKLVNLTMQPKQLKLDILKEYRTYEMSPNKNKLFLRQVFTSTMGTNRTFSLRIFRGR